MEREEAIEVIRKNYPHVGSSGTEFETALRELIPELEESEDERIRNLIYCLIRDRSDNQKLLEHNGVSVDKALAYLENQKEKPKTVDSIPPFCVSNVKWVDTIITMAIVALSDDVDYNRDEPCKYRQEIDDLKKLRDVLCGKKEQKPIISAEESLGISQEEYNKIVDECIYGEDKEQTPILEVFGFKVGDAVRLKDGDGRKHIIKSFEEVEGIHGPNFFHVEFEDNSARVSIYPDKEYPNGYYTQMEKFEEEQKPAWSEEDEKKIHFLSRLIEFQVKNDEYCFSEGRFVSKKEAIKMLKSLRPSWKPSEEQIGALNEIINVLAVSKHPHENDYLFNILSGLRKNLKSL